MAKPYSITITNGTGTARVLNGNYSVSADVTGYDNASILPQSLEVIEGTNSYSLKIAATGSLTLHVTEDGTAGGTIIQGATFYRTDSTGNTTYGDAITTDNQGNAVLTNVPWAAADAPFVYYKQTASDGEHEFDGTVKQISLTQQQQTVEIANALSTERTFTLEDANYSGLPIASGTITLS